MYDTKTMFHYLDIYKRLNNLDIIIYEKMFNLMEESLLFRSGSNLRIRILSDFFNEVISVMWHILKLSIFVS